MAPKAAAVKRKNGASEDKAAKKKPRKTKTRPGITVEKRRHAAADPTQEDISRDKFSALPISRLKDFLRTNKQMLSGKKAELIERCVDGETNGALPLCPTCGFGKLKLSEDITRVICGGYYDEDCSMHIQCTFTDDVNAIERNVWKNPEDEDDDLETASKGIKSEKGNNTGQALDISTVVAAFIKETPDVNSINLRDLCSKTVEFCRSSTAKIKLPLDDSLARQKVGAVLMRCKNEDGIFAWDDVFKNLVDEFGIEISISAAKANKQLTPKKRAQIPENEPIADLLDEVAKLTAKAGGNQFKIRSLKKAAIALRGLEFKITNGVELSKGKKKVAGIGKGTGAMIDEFLTNGVVKELEELRKEVGSA